jgi:hypothetical protein
VNFQRSTLPAINLITAVGAGALLVSSLWPGFGNGCWVCLALPLAVLLGIAWLWTALSARRAAVNRPTLRQMLLAPALVVATVLLLYSQVPLRIAFATVQARLQSHVVTAPVLSNADMNTKPLGPIGMYRVDAYATDPRGGVYFRTGTGQDGMGPDTMSFGFAFRPNTTGTPFGRARYRIRHLSGEWYWFAASNDY